MFVSLLGAGALGPVWSAVVGMEVALRGNRGSLPSVELVEVLGGGREGMFSLGWDVIDSREELSQ